MWNTGTMRINPQKSKSLDFTTTCATTHTTAQATASCIGIRPWHNSIHLQPSSINTIIRILAVISYFTARAVRLDEENCVGHGAVSGKAAGVAGGKFHNERDGSSRLEVFLKSLIACDIPMDIGSGDALWHWSDSVTL